MKHKLILTLCAASLLLASCNAPNKEYKLVKTIEVSGRQGVACDGEYYYVSGSTALYKYSLDGKLLQSNENPFENLPLAANHIGDIDVYNGEIYAGIETFIDGVGTNIQAAIFSTDDLKWKRSINWAPESGQVEVCGLAVDSEAGKVYMADWVNGSYLYRYDINTGEFDGKVKLEPAPALQQGIAVCNGKMYISSDCGDAQQQEPDKIYYYDMSSSDDVAMVQDFMLMKDFKRTGEIEGLCFNPETEDLVVLNNRGAHIVKGMPKGFYPGYDKEIHELYVFSTRPVSR